MTISARHVRGAAAVVGVALAAACGSDDVQITDPSIAGGTDLFRSYVALGNSITAGYQSGGINDSTQRESYAYLFAKQLYGSDVGARFKYPSLVMPGCSAPLTSLTGTRVGGVADGTCFYRDPASISATLNNVAVPGARVADPTRSTTVNSNTLTTLFLGGSSQVRRAVNAQPTFATVWIGNNDVLDNATKGVTGAVTALNTQAIPTATAFAAAFKPIIDSLRLAPTLKGGVLIGVVNVTQVPILFPAPLLANPQFKAAFDQYVGRATPVTVLPDCATSTSLISFGIVTFLRANPAVTVIGCTKNVIPGNAVIGDYFILDAAEQASLTATVNGYNAYIKAKADSIGFGYIDPNPSVAALKTSGAIPSAPNLANPANPYGAYISIDGVHPAKALHIVIANALIDAVNAKYSVTIPKVTVTTTTVATGAVATP